MAKKYAWFLLSVLFLLLVNPGGGRQVTSNFSSGEVSDGIENGHQPTNELLLRGMVSSDTCEQTYGFLPCTSSVLGNIFLIVVYSYLMFLGAKFLSDGSEILLEILGPGIIGGLFLPLLSSFPDAVIILASGLSGSQETAQSQVSIGMGLLAGSIVMLLTILWGSCIVVGKCDIVRSIAKDLQDTKGFSLTGSGASTDIWTSYAAKIMIISIIPLIIVQLPKVFQATSQTRLAILISLIVCIALLLSYCLYQIFQPWIQKRRLAYAKYKHVKSGVLKHLKMHSLGRLFKEDGEPNIEVIQKIFTTIDQNSDGYLSPTELRSFLVGVQFELIDLDIDDAVKKIMRDIDTSRDSLITLDEFVIGISKWLRKAKRSASYAGDYSSQTIRYLTEYNMEALRDHDLLGSGDQSYEVVETIENPKWNAYKAVSMLLLGTAIAAAIADPLVDVVDNFSTATSIPSFFVSFVVLPFASSSEAVTSLIFASRKKLATASLTFSAIYGSVTMSNLFSLAVFLGLVYFRQLTWNFTSEVLIILIVCIVMGIFASVRTTFPLWTCLVAYALYPLSLAMAYILKYVIGLS